MLPRSKPDKEWLMNAIEVFMSNVPGEDDGPWASVDMADHILGNWLTIEMAQDTGLLEAAKAVEDMGCEHTCGTNVDLAGRWVGHVSYCPMPALRAAIAAEEAKRG